VRVHLAQTTPSGGAELTGLVGLVADLVDAIGPAGVALVVAVENLFPPIPSEAVLPFAGFVVGQEGGSPWAMVLAATIGSVGGAVLLYELGRAVGLDRTRRWLARLPLVEAEEVDAAIAWFHRHGGSSVFFGRCVPLIRSLVSLPAGADGMPRGRFLLLTTAGSLLWNVVWVFAGYLLGSRWESAARYSDLMSTGLVALLGLIGLRFVWTRRDRLRPAR
jgi:membrane protein DedA with SNARE-associated domain